MGSVCWWPVPLFPPPPPLPQNGRVAERPCRMDHGGSIQGPETWLSISGVLSFAGLKSVQDSDLARGRRKRALVRPLRQGKARLEKKGAARSKGPNAALDYVRSEGSCTLGDGCATFCNPPPPWQCRVVWMGSASLFDLANRQKHKPRGCSKKKGEKALGWRSQGTSVIRLAERHIEQRPKITGTVSPK